MICPGSRGFGRVESVALLKRHYNSPLLLASNSSRGVQRFPVDFKGPAVLASGHPPGSLPNHALFPEQQLTVGQKITVIRYQNTRHCPTLQLYKLSCTNCLSNLSLLKTKSSILMVLINTATYIVMCCYDILVKNTSVFMF